MVEIKGKKRKLVKESTDNNTTVEKPKIKKKKKHQKTAAGKPITPVVQEADTDSSSDDESAADPDQIQKLLEPYSKEQLIEFIVEAAANDESLYKRIRETADKDVSHRKIFVYGLGWDTTRETLLAAFKPFGDIEDCNVIMDRVTGKAKGFGFVQFASRQCAAKALKEPRKKIGNRMTSCQLASLGRAAPSTDSSNRKIYVSNVQGDVDPEKLRVFFAKFGEIENGPMGFDATGKSRGFALFVYKTEEGMKKALEEPIKVFEGHQLNCQKAAEGKSKVTASITTGVQPLQQPTPPVLAVAAAQNLALLGQHPAFNPMYGGLFANTNPGFVNPLLASQIGSAGGAGVIGGYGGYGNYGGGGIAGSSSLVGSYNTGTTGTSVSGMGLQHAYPGSGVGQDSTSRTQGASTGSYKGYSSYFWTQHHRQIQI